MIHYVNNDSDLAAVATSAGDTVLFATGATFQASAVPAAMLSPDNVTVGAYGTGSKPVISGGTARTDWVFDAGNNVYSRPAYSVGTTLGNVTEDGVPMKFVQWNTNIATTAASMVSGESLPAWSGSMTFDPTNRIVYIRPSDGVAAEHVYVVSDNGTASGNGLSNSTSSTGLAIDGLEIRNVSRHGILLYAKRSLTLSDVDLRVVGGAKPSTLYMGNGVELSYGCNGAQILRCSASDIFDSGFTTQLYESTAQVLSDHYYEDCTVLRFGMHGVEVSVQTASQFIYDVEINGLTGTDAGTYSWAGNRNGALVTCLSNALNSGRVNRVFARGVVGSRMNRLYLGYQHGGLCGVEESSATGTYGAAPTSAPNGATNQRDLWRNVTDNLGAPSGGVWTQVTANLSDSFLGSV